MIAIKMFMIDNPDIFYHIYNPEEIQGILNGEYDENVWDWEWIKLED